jgi:hypothetical protein
MSINMKKTVKKIKKDFERELSIIANKIEPRIIDVCSKFQRGIENEATMFAFWVGMREDLISALEEIERRNGNKRRN